MDERAITMLRRVASQAIRENGCVRIDGNPLITLLDAYAAQRARVADLERAEAVAVAARAYVLAEHEITSDIESVRRCRLLWHDLVAAAEIFDPAIATVVGAWQKRRRSTNEGAEED